MGYMVGVEYTEYEWPLNLLRFIVVVTVAIQVIGTILRRRASRFYVSLWYTLAAGIWTIFNLSLGAVSPNIGAAGRSQNGYTGTVNLAEFDRVTTHGDGAVGIQISRPVGRIVVRRGIETFGGTGQSLVKGVVMTLSAVALSIKPGGSAREIEINGGLKTNGSAVPPIEQHGAIESFRIAGGCVAAGGGFDKI